ncbi:MFS general substrate transporter [Calocera cornea HHB12733]|uniref:MFS general substrate transporter n=1 Tax=Calocera cornea HHB12733 TaxID=1353952 RepID=A0A165F1K2_9BASI|nr:MFS general substrate transporter [Calocera cornea HHB12733]
MSEGDIEKTFVETTSVDAIDAVSLPVLKDVSAEDFAALERRVVWKTDLSIMPLTILLFWLASLDRGNLGLARLQGLPDDVLGGDPTGSLYAWCSSIFYISYLLTQLPANLMIKRFNPAIVLGASVFFWGVASAAMAGSRNEAGILACRLFIGMAEGGFAPAIPLYYSFFYTRAEHGKRNALFMGVSSVAGAFGGLIAYGITTIPNPPLQSWRILFLIEGLPTVLVGIATIFILPTHPRDSKSFTEEEKAVLIARISKEVEVEEDRAVAWKHVKEAVCDWRVWVMGLAYQSLNLSLGSIVSFLPTIIATLETSKARAQLMTVPPYVAAFATQMTCAFLSDRFQVRGPFIMFALVIAGFGYMMLLVDHSHFSVRYGGAFLACMGTYTGVPLTLSWAQANFGSETKRAAAIAIVFGFGQTFSVVASFIWPTTDGPYYKLGFTLCMTWQFWGALVSLFLMIYFKRENDRRDREEGKPEDGFLPKTGEFADKAPGYRYMV